MVQLASVSTRQQQIHKLYTTHQHNICTYISLYIYIYIYTHDTKHEMISTSKASTALPFISPVSVAVVMAELLSARSPARWLAHSLALNDPRVCLLLWCLCCRVELRRLEVCLSCCLARSLACSIACWPLLARLSSSRHYLLTKPVSA